MADVFYGVNRGQADGSPHNVLVDTSTSATDIELRIDTGKGLTRNEVELLLGAIRRKLLDGGNTNYPPL